MPASILARLQAHTGQPTSILKITDSGNKFKPSANPTLKATSSWTKLGPKHMFTAVSCRLVSELTIQSAEASIEQVALGAEFQQVVLHL